MIDAEIVYIRRRVRPKLRIAFPKREMNVAGINTKFAHLNKCQIRIDTIHGEDTYPVNLFTDNPQISRTGVLSFKDIENQCQGPVTLLGRTANISGLRLRKFKIDLAHANDSE